MINTPLDATIGSHVLNSNGIDNNSVDLNEDEARETAKKFEALLLQTMLKNMRAATADDGLLNNEHTGLYMDMLDQQVSKEISKSSSFGLAETIYRQLIGQSATPIRKTTAATTPLYTQAVMAPGAIDTHYKPANNTPAGFVERIRPAARQTALALGTSTEAVVAVAALETGWGRSIAMQSDGSSTHNLFGIKADSRWQGDTSMVRTHEFTNGHSHAENAEFRVYRNEQQSIRDFGSFLQSNPRYKTAIQSAQDPEQFIRELQRAGYATDPDYADKVISIMNSINTMQK